MADLWRTIQRVERAITRQRSSRNTWGGGRSSRRSDGSWSIGPNAPRMITVVLSVVLAVVGLVVTDTVAIGFVTDLLASADLNLTREQGYWLLLGSPVLLILGSLLPGI